MLQPLAEVADGLGLSGRTHARTLESRHDVNKQVVEDRVPGVVL